MSVLVEINKLTFTHKHAQQPTLSEVSLCINQGDRFGLFGPNGAGKTTLLSLICGLYQAQSGSIVFKGKYQHPQANIKQLIGFVPQDFAFYGELTPMQNLAFFGAWSNLNKKQIHQRSEELLYIFGRHET
jgi:ABC-2 type transport system ATP-binding protein